MGEKCNYRKCRGMIVLGQDEIIFDDGDRYHYDCFVKMKRKRMSGLERKNDAGEITRREAAEYDDIKKLIVTMENRKEIYSRENQIRSLEQCPSLGGSSFFNDDDGRPIYLDGRTTLKLPKRKPLTALEYVRGCRKILDSIKPESQVEIKMLALVADVRAEIKYDDNPTREEAWGRLLLKVIATEDKELKDYFDEQFAISHGMPFKNPVPALTSEQKED